jgi:sensor c-di-GMP phosphodiesterase-like protein
VAEGVETSEQLRFLNDKGCHIYQGYHFSKPLPKDLFLDYLNNATVTTGENNYREC